MKTFVAKESFTIPGTKLVIEKGQKYGVRTPKKEDFYEVPFDSEPFQLGADPVEVEPGDQIILDPDFIDEPVVVAGVSLGEEESLTGEAKVLLTGGLSTTEVVSHLMAEFGATESEAWLAVNDVLTPVVAETPPEVDYQPFPSFEARRAAGKKD